MALDDTVQHLRFIATLALSPVQSRFVYQLIATFLSAMQLPDEQYSSSALRDRVKLLLTTNCVELLPGTTYVDTTHLLAVLDLPLPPSPPSATAGVDGSSAVSVTPATSRPSTGAGKRPPLSTKNKPAAPPSPQQQPIKPSKPLTAKEKEAAAAADKAAAAAAAEAAAAEAAALAALPPLPPTPPPHFLTAAQMERVWRYVERLLILQSTYRAVYNKEARSRRDEQRTEYVWQRAKQEPESGWVRPLLGALSEQPVVEEKQQPVAATVAEAVAVSGAEAEAEADAELTLQDGDYSAEERSYLLRMKAEMEKQLRDALSAVRQQRNQQQTETGKVEESKEQDATAAGPASVVVAVS